MAFRKPKSTPRFADLKGILAQTKDTENPAYQVIQEIIERLDQTRDVTEEKFAAIVENVLKNVANKFATYHTKEDETAVLPNSVQVLAGMGITLDHSVPNKVTISAGMSGYYDCPLSDGDTDEADLIFVNGKCIIVQVPIPT